MNKYVRATAYMKYKILFHIQNPVRQERKLIIDMETELCVFRCVQSQEHGIVLYLYHGLELRMLDFRLSQW